MRPGSPSLARVRCSRVNGKRYTFTVYVPYVMNHFFVAMFHGRDENPKPRVSASNTRQEHAYFTCLDPVIYTG